MRMRKAPEEQECLVEERDGVGGPTAAGDESSRHQDRDRARLVVAAALFFAYNTLLVNRMAFTVLQPALLEITGSPAETMAQDRIAGLNETSLGYALAIGTVAYVAGKLALTPFVDPVGGKRCMVACCILTAATSLAMACTSSLPWIVGWMCVSRFCQAPAWAAMTKVAESTFPHRMLGRIFSVLSLASRSGSMCSGMLTGIMLHNGADWRGVLAAAALLSIAAAGLSQLCLADAKPAGARVAHEPKKKKNTDEAQGHHPLNNAASFREAAWWMLRQPQFQAMALAILMLCPVSEFNALVPVYLKKTLQMDDARVAFAAAVMPSGAVLSLVVGGLWYDSWGRAQQRLVICSALVAATAALAAMAAFDMPETCVLALLFVIGLAYPVCYYLPVGVFSIDCGGPRFCGACSGLLDVVGYLSVIPFNALSGSLAATVGWPVVVGSLAVMTGCSAVLFALFFSIEPISLQLHPSA
jgi:sugar phosphate permease